jgi:glc operon protein GlcG
MKTIAITALSTCILASTATAQVADHKVLTLDGAKQVAAAAVAEAKRNNEGSTIAIVDDGGNLLYVERLDGTFGASGPISIGKARTAALFKKPTSAFEDIIKNGRTAMVALADFTPLQGGVPILVGGSIVGAIGVSGASNQQRDEAVAKAGAAALQ